MSRPEESERVVSDEERARALLEQLKGVHAVDVARDMALGLVNFSSPKLGLTDETRALRDLEDVRVSIEVLRAVVGVLDAEPGPQAHDLHDALAQLQLAYAHAVQLANAEAAGAAGAPAAERAQAGERDDADAAPQAEDAAEPPATGSESHEEPAARQRPRARSTKDAPAMKKPATKKKPDDES